MNALETRGLSVCYGRVEAVQGVDLDVPAGGLTALVGPSGCGKTSLMRAITGFEVPTAGTIHLAGEEVSGPNCWLPPERRKVGIVFQQGALFPHLNVLHNVRYGLQGQADREARAREALELVGMGEKGSRFPDELSGGEQQRVALARALAPRPRIVLLDEPFASLDAALRRRLREEVKEILHATDTTAILVTHDQEEALSIAGTVAVMMAGQLLQHATPDEIYHRPASPEVARFVGDGQLFECQSTGGEARSLFGRVASRGPDGPGWLLVRPEDLQLAPPSQASLGGDPDARAALLGKVRRREFFGHDLIHEVLTDTGEVVRARTTTEVFEVGDPVLLRLRENQRFQVFGRRLEEVDEPGAP